MKQLVLVRHAKSSWSFPQLADIDRPLNRRGMGDAPLMAEKLLERVKDIDGIYSSPAVRALDLAEHLVRDRSEVPLAVWPSLYTFSSDSLLQALRNLEDRRDRILVVGHNPAITIVANYLARELVGESVINNIPTSGVVSLRCDMQNWSDLNADCAELEFFDYPKNYR